MKKHYRFGEAPEDVNVIAVDEERARQIGKVSPEVPLTGVFELSTAWQEK
jgi:hypothetical protein